MKIKILAVLIILVISGCSSFNRDGSITSPQVSIDKDSLANHNLPIVVSDRFPDGTPSAGQGLLGLFSLAIDSKSQTATIEPLRKTSLTDALEVVDITNFLAIAPCVNCVKIKSMSLDLDGNFVVEIGIKHPFDVGDPLKPITGRNRADLHVFNVEGIVVSSSSGISFPGLGETIPGFRLLSADGYTSYLDPSLDEIFTTPASIHPYVLHFDDYGSGNFDASNPMGFESVTEPPPSGNLVMAMGCDYDYQNYVFDLNGSSMEFIFAVGCTYAVSAASKSLRFNPEYRVPQHNKKAASEVRVEIVNNGLKGDDMSSSAEFAIRVLDMSHNVSVGDGLDEMLADSSVASIAVEIPGVTASPVVQTSPTPVSGNGRDPMDPLNFPITVTNSASASEGEYTGIVKVLDSYSPGLNGSPLLNGMDGIERVSPYDNPLTALFDIDEFATYNVFKIDVAVGALLEACFVANPEEVRLEVDATINFDGSCSNDPNGYNIVSFEWDFDWDGNPSNFVPDVTTGTPTTSYLYTKAGTHTVALKVTNDAIPPQTSDIFSDDVIVHGWVLPPVKLTDSSVNSTFMWFNDTKIGSTSDGMIHVVVENFMQDWSHNVDYYMCDETGTVESQTLYTTNEIVDVGMVISSTEEVYAFYVKLTGGVCYRKKGASGFEPEVVAVTQSPGNYIEAASYAINSDGDIGVVTSEWRTCPQPTEIYFAVNEGSGFVKSFVSNTYRWIECSGGGGSGVLIVVDSVADLTGKFHLTWAGKIAPDTSTLTNIYYAYYDGTISSVTNASTDNYCGAPIMRVDADNNVWCAYMTNAACKMAIKPAASNVFNPSFIVVNWQPGVMTPHYGTFDINRTTGDIMYLYDARFNPTYEYYCMTKIFNVSDTPTDIQNALQFRLDESTTQRQWWPGVTSCANGHWYAIWDDQRNLPSTVAHGDLYFAMYY